MERKPKTIFQLDSPFTEVTWPQITPQDQDAILELLCRLLAPIGQHRVGYTIPSEGRRAKRKKLNKESRMSTEINHSQPPEIASFVVVGLNSITRCLECLSGETKPTDTTNDESHGYVPTRAEADVAILESTRVQTESFSAIFVAMSSLPSMLQAHLPQLVYTASLARPGAPPIRLVQLPRGSEERLAAATGFPRNSFVGLREGAPLAKPLTEIIRAAVSPVQVPWLDPAGKAKYLPLKVNPLQTSAPVSKMARA